MAFSPCVCRSTVSPLRMMADESAPEGAAPAEAPAEAPAPAPVDMKPKFSSEAAQGKWPWEEGFDWTQYSLTIGIFTLFVIVKTFSALGIVDLSD